MVGKRLQSWKSNWLTAATLHDAAEMKCRQSLLQDEHEAGLLGGLIEKELP